MENPTAEELWLIRELASEGHLSAEQVKQILEIWKKLSEEDRSISIATIISKSGFVKPDVLKNYLKIPFPQTNPVPPENSLKQTEINDNKIISEDIFLKIENLVAKKLLGNGNIGSSYLTTIKGQDSRVIKLINPKLLENKGYINSVKKGLEIIDYQHHPFLIPHQYSETNTGEIYFTSKYIENDSIGTIIKASGRLELNSALEIIRKACDILKFFERIKSPHLGLHPENIFRGEDGNIYLKDFEWNRRFFTEIEDRVSYGPGICYMSPEYIKGQNIDNTSDIYSLGILLYYLLARRVPFHGNLETQLAKKIKLDYPDISEVHKNIPIHIGGLIKKMIEPNRSDRYQNFEQLITDLDEILKKRYLNDASMGKSSHFQEAKTTSGSDRKLSPIDFNESLKKTNEPLPVSKSKKYTPYLALLILGVIIYLMSQVSFNQTSGHQEKKSLDHKNIKPEVVNKKNADPLDESVLVEGEKPTNQEVVVNNETVVEIQDKIKSDLLLKVDNSKDAKKFGKKLNAIKVIQENLKDDPKISRVILNKIIAEELVKIDNERQDYWNEQKEKLKKLLTEKNEEKSQELIELINKETENDEEIQNRVFHLRVETQKLDPEESKIFVLDNESKVLKETVASKSNPLLENHDYTALIELLSNSLKKEKNINQKQVYAEQLEFYEHAEKIKKFSQNISVKSDILLRSLYLDEDGELEAVSSKGFHVKGSNNKIVLWKDISAKALSALVARFEPTSLGESISLLIYASRAGNHIAMKKALRTIEQKYGASMNTPLIKESQEKLKELKDYLEEDTIKWQLGLIKILKSRNTLKAKKDAEILIKELRDEYLSTPIYKKYDAEIKDIMAALNQIK